MASPRNSVTTPLTFELPRSLVDHIHVLKGRCGLRSVSDVVRRALEAYDLAAFETPDRDQCQISVRLPPARKRSLFSCARRHQVSAGELLRAALESFAPKADASSAGKQKKSRGKAGANR